MKTIIKDIKINDKTCDILIDGDQIVEIGENLIVSADKIIDGKNKYAFAGLSNCYFDGTPADVLKLPEQGVTTVFDFSFNEDVTRKIVDLGLNCYVAIGCNNNKSIIDEHFLENEINRLNNIDAKIVPILYAENPATIEECFFEILINFASKHGYMLATRASETLEEVGQIDNKYGFSPISLLEEYGFLDRKHMIINAVYIDKDDVSKLKQYDSIVCTCPTNNLKDGYGIAPVYSFMKNNLSVVVGGVNSNQFKEIALVSDLQCAKLNERNVIDNDELYKISSDISIIDNKHHTLCKGSIADIVITDSGDFLNLTPLNVVLTIASGRVIYKK